MLGRKAGVQGELGVADEAAKACLKRHTLKKGGKWCGGEGKWCGGGGKWCGGEGKWCGGEGKWCGGEGKWCGGGAKC